MFREQPPRETKEAITYLCAYSSLAPFGEEIINRTRAGHPRGCFGSKHLQIDSNLENAQANALEKMRKELLSSIDNRSIFGLPETLIADQAVIDDLRNIDRTVILQQIKTLKLSDFKPNVFLTFELRCNKNEINEWLEKRRYIEVAKHIVRITDSAGNELTSGIRKHTNSLRY